MAEKRLQSWMQQGKGQWIHRWTGKRMKPVVDHVMDSSMGAAAHMTMIMEVPMGAGMDNMAGP